MAALRVSGAVDSAETALSFTLKYWCLWQSDETATTNRWPGGQVLPCNGGSADVSFLPMMQRRRLSPLARAACAVAWHCREAAGEMPAVFFSNHGESQYYFEMLNAMAMGEAVSPSRFSLCVHNAIAGLYSLQTGSVLPYLSLAGGTEDLFAAFIEARGLLSEVAQVMTVCYEQPLPKAYQAYLSVPEKTWALALVLARPAEAGLRLRLKRESVSDAGSAAEKSDLPQAIVSGRRSGCCGLERSVWRWSLDGV
ncbi:beta-ketoacyl synthase chain length factor [Methylomonas sp. MgM2]